MTGWCQHLVWTSVLRIFLLLIIQPFVFTSGMLQVRGLSTETHCHDHNIWQFQAKRGTAASPELISRGVRHDINKNFIWSLIWTNDSRLVWWYLMWPGLKLSKMLRSGREILTPSVDPFLLCCWGIRSGQSWLLFLVKFTPVLEWLLLCNNSEGVAESLRLSQFHQLCLHFCKEVWTSGVHG